MIVVVQNANNSCQKNSSKKTAAAAIALLLLFEMLVAGWADTDQDRSSALTPGLGRTPIGGEMIT